MDALFYLLAIAIIVATAIGIAKSAGLNLPQPILILIYGLLALACLYILWSFVPSLPHRP